jgi:hypothetical protein
MIRAHWTSMYTVTMHRVPLKAATKVKEDIIGSYSKCICNTCVLVTAPQDKVGVYIDITSAAATATATAADIVISFVCTACYLVCV